MYFDTLLTPFIFISMFAKIVSQVLKLGLPDCEELGRGPGGYSECDHAGEGASDQSASDRTSALVTQLTAQSDRRIFKGTSSWDSKCTSILDFVEL